MSTILEAVFLMKPSEAVKRIEQLSRREKEVAELLSLGLSNKAVAERLGISIKTGDIHRGKVKKKLKTTVQGIARIWFLAKLANA